VRTKLRVLLASHLATSQIGGFTLLEIMTVVVITGILAAISMPFFISRANTAKQTEGKMLVGVLNRSQQAYYTEHARFADNLDAMAIRLNSQNYDFDSRSASGSGLYAMNFATSKVATIRSYAGMAAILQDAAGNQGMLTIMCEAESPGDVQAPRPQYNVSTIECASGTRPVNSSR